MVRFVSDLYRYRHPLSPGDVDYESLSCVAHVVCGSDLRRLRQRRVGRVVHQRDGSVPVFVVVVRGVSRDG